MSQRSVAEYQGTYIGIESVFTVIDGKQINIPGVVEDLRWLARRNELFCPCGCGTNLTPVISDKSLREQHFRIKTGHLGDGPCTAVEEGRVSIDSKIVLKCWLDDKLQTEDMEARVPICEVGDTTRKYEYTFLSRSKGIGVSYCHSRTNLSDEKLDLLESNRGNFTVLYFQDAMNSNGTEQYPEWLIKIYQRQGYLLLLQVKDCLYRSAKLRVAFIEYVDGLWHEITILEDNLTEFELSETRELLYAGKTIPEHKERYLEEQWKQREKEERAWQAKEEERRLIKQIVDEDMAEKRRRYHEEQERKRRGEVE
jgi:hypothetical protein